MFGIEEQITALVRNAGLGRQTPDQRARIDAVLFALWALGHRERSKASTLWRLPLGLLSGGVVGLSSLPSTVLRHLPEVFLAGALSALLVSAFDSIAPVNGIALFSAVLIYLLKDKIIVTLRHVFFDVGDFFTLGRLSRTYIDAYFAFGSSVVLDDNDGFKLHLFTSRILTSEDVPYEAEAAAFQKLVAFQQNNWPELRTEIDEYWKTFPEQPNYWRSALSRHFRA